MGLVIQPKGTNVSIETDFIHCKGKVNDKHFILKQAKHVYVALTHAKCKFVAIAAMMFG